MVRRAAGRWSRLSEAATNAQTAHAESRREDTTGMEEDDPAHVTAGRFVSAVPMQEAVEDRLGQLFDDRLS